jgi:N-acetylated-alpha-linked acidic dipeptidase
MTALARATLSLLTLIAICNGNQAAAATPLLGYSADSSAAERAAEARFDTALSGAAILARLREASSAPNQIGSAHNKSLAYQAMERLRSWGWDAHVEVFSVLYPSPSRIALELLEPRHFRANVTEPPVPGDSLSRNTNDVLPAYLVYGADGDVTASIVYVNYGFDEDYTQLDRMGVSVRGRIVIARYGGGWRGLKVKLAYLHGAVGCVLYSDPADDGYGKGDVYPHGPWRPAHSVQRGSVLDLPVRPGNPLANAPDEQSSQTVRPEQAPTIAKIPVVPLSYADAEPFLSSLEGPVAPAAWRGALPITYHVGPGPARAHLAVHSQWNPTSLYNVIAVIQGSVWPDQWVIRGNNRDTWVYGAWDSLSGHSVMLEEAKAIGGLLESGWRPKRTLVYASWDGEEAGLLGSVEWTRSHADELREKAVAYVNSGPYGRGLFEASASYSTSELIDQAASEVEDPETHTSIRERALATQAVHEVRSAAPNAAAVPSAANWRERPLPVGELGAGSDYTAFLQHLGVPSIDLGFRGEDGGAAVAHSIYDDYQHFERFSDPQGEYGVALARVAGRLVLRTADAEVVPFEFSHCAEKIRSQVDEITALVTRLRLQHQAMQQLRDSGAVALAADPLLSARQSERPVPSIELQPLHEAAAALDLSARAYSNALANLDRLTPQRKVELNALLQQLERRLIDSRGLPGRPWYRHLLYEPSLSNGYAASTLPGIREALNSGNWSQAQEFVGRTAAALNDYKRGIDEATQLLTQ